MLHVILFILKILGILLLVCVGLLLLILYTVMFVAVSYRVQAKKKEETFLVSGSVAWLFRMVAVHFRMDEKTGLSPILQVRLFGRPVWRILGEEESKKSSKKPQKKRRRRRERKQPERKEAEPVKKEPERKAEQREPAQKEPAPSPEPPKTEQKSPIPLKTKKKQKEPSFFSKFLEKIIGVIQKICHKIRQIRAKITGVSKTIQRFRDKRDAFLEFWRMEEHCRARKAILKEGRYLWKKSRPQKAKGQIRFGFSDPAQTGLCMGVAGMFCAWYPKKFQVIPDFDQEILEGEIWIGGKIRCYVFVKILVRIYFNKDVRHMYQHWKKL